ncbi:MAG: hypothetical protein JW388_1181 [Nitrospira sp.]|nr:hypothetical protein [Nitrospira sp.]
MIGLGLEGDGAIQLDGHQPPAETGILGLVDQEGLDPGRRDFFDAVQEFFDRAKLSNQLHRRFLTDTLHAGNIVRRIAHKPHDLDNARRLHAETLNTVRFTKPFVFYRIVDAHVGSQELEHILVARDDDDIIPILLRLVREGTDQIVCLMPGLSDGGDVEGIHDAMDIGNLSAHPVRHRWPLRFVVFELRVAQGRPFFVKRHNNSIRLLLANNLQQHRREAEDGVGLKTFGIIHRRQGEEGTIDVRASIDQIERLAAGIVAGHGV